ncbi:MAG: hypothetical protein OHK005_02530 [Candidatus Methylacidiphilales bacterium]
MIAPALAELWPEIRRLLVGSWQELRCRCLPLAGSLGVVLAFVVWLWPQDRTNLEMIQGWGGPESRPLAEAISFYGDFYTGSVALVLLIWLTGVITGRRTWRRLALAVFLASAVAGISVNGFRLTLGRPRPSTGVPDGFYGLQASAGYHGFPSGHAATAFGTAGPIVFTSPAWALPALAMATSVGWSRMQLDRHYPTDILVGAWFGLAAGFLLSGGLRRANAEERADAPATYPGDRSSR